MIKNFPSANEEISVNPISQFCSFFQFQTKATRRYFFSQECTSDLGPRAFGVAEYMRGTSLDVDFLVGRIK
jgi:hypothetical protein